MKHSPNTQIAETFDPLVPDLVASAFDERAGYRVMRRRGASTWLLILTTGGLGMHRWRNGETACPPGMVTLWEPGVYQEYYTDPVAAQWSFSWAHFIPHSHWRHFLDWPALGEGLRGFQLDPAESSWRLMAADLDEIANLAAQGGYLERLLAQSQMESLLIRLRMLAPSSRTETGDPRLDRAIALAMSGLDEPIGVEQMAEAAGLSVSRFAELFRSQLGESPRAYVEKERLVRARQMLAMTNLPIRSIAAQLGYESPFYFAHRFRVLTGESPSAYRRRWSTPDPEG